MSGIVGKNANRSSGVIGTAAGGIASLSADSSPQLGGFLDAAGNYIQMEKGGDISSASPTVIDTDGDYFLVTGTNNFSAFSVAADRHFFLEFGAVLTMTHGNGTLDLPGGANIQTAPSDVGEFISTATNVVTCVNYTKRDGTAVVLADNAITLAKMAGNTDGVIITYDASGDPVVVGPGSDGEVLTSTGAGSPPAFEAAGGGAGLVFLGEAVASDSDSLDFLSSFSSTYDDYMLVWEGIQVGLETAIVSMRVAIGGSAKTDSSGYVYGAVGATETTSSNLGSAGINMVRTHAASAANGTGESNAGVLFFHGVNNTAMHKLFTWQSALENPSTVFVTHHGGGSYQSDTAALSGCQMLSSSGDLNVGKARLYGIVKA